MENKFSYGSVVVKQLRPLHDWILVADMSFEERKTASGIILLKDDGKSSGIRPRWGKVYSVGPKQTQVKAGQWVCVEHGRWTRGVEIEDETGKYTLRRIDSNAIMLVTDELPQDETMSDAVVV